MTESMSTILSVRGTARVDVPPDMATLGCLLEAVDDTPPAALNTASRRLDALRAALAELGGAARTASSQREPLTWLARAATTHDEYDHMHDGRRTGRTVAVVRLVLEVRDFTLLQRVGEVLAVQSGVTLEHVSWSADDDNAGWPRVRADAIKAAISRGSDYAAALGGRLQRLDHLADQGLLAAGDQDHARVASLAAMSFGKGGGDMPSLDPEPIELTAVIEARFAASLPALG